MKSILLPLIVWAIALPMPGFSQDRSEDKNLTQSSWRVESSKFEGVDDPSTNGLIFIFEDGTITVKNGELVKSRGTYKLDPNKSPKTFDIAIGASTYRGIYKLDGETLVMSHGDPGGERSTQFVSIASPPNKVLTVLRRENN